ncbi:MAG TPA: GlsB/YeaQ/YmgE family stress response membrane protein [Acidimicrobiia bacterium]|nr:GlsB/YeaQ/YmgE family stress response membrane protein [Acidimicrobiia bacterium]
MDEGIWTTIWQGLLAGIIIGPLARLVLPGRQAISLVMTILIGAVGAIGGGLIYEAFGGGETSGVDWIRLIVQVGVAALLVILYGSMRRGSTAT